MRQLDTSHSAVDTIRVSIVMPVFNAAKFLDISVKSVLWQSACDWELILVDDGSSDDSVQICRRYVQKDVRIRMIAQTNRGPSAARNAGVHIACGEFVFFLDADDYILPDTLANLLYAADEHDTDMVLGNFCKQEGSAPLIHQPVVFSPQGGPFLGECKILVGKELLDYTRHFLAFPSNHLVSYCWARLYRRSVILEHGLKADENMRLFEDFAFNLDFLGKARRLVFINKPVYVYVLHERHVSASMAIINSRRLTSDMQAFQNKLDVFLDAIGADNTAAERVRREAGHTLVHYAIIFLVRTCRQLRADNRLAIFREMREFVDSKIMRESLPCYEPRPGSSRVVPVLMRLKLIRLMAVICKWKGNRRYGRLGNTTT